MKYINEIILIKKNRYINLKFRCFGSDAASSALCGLTQCPTPTHDNLLCKISSNYIDQFNVVEQKEQYLSP